MRILINKLLKERDLTPYGLAISSGGRISLSTAHRLARKDGRLDRFDSRVLDDLCDIFDVGPGELLERDRGGAKRER